MKQSDEVVYKKKSFLPSLKLLKNKSSFGNNKTILYENNLKREKEIFEIGFDKFAELTYQPSSIENIKIGSFIPKSYSIEDLLNNNLTNSTNFEWSTKEFPKLKINKSSNQNLNYFEKPSEKKKKLLFEQKILLEQKQFEQNLRNIRTDELLSKSNEAYKRISKENSKKRSFEKHFKKDLWSSCDFRDINLKNDIINTFYKMDNRSIRHYGKIRNDFFNFTPNKVYQGIKDQSYRFDMDV